MTQGKAFSLRIPIIMKPSTARTLVALGISVTSWIAIQATINAQPRKQRVPMPSESHFARRVGEAKVRALRETGGTAESEAAVAAALKWLAEHQLEDGGWSFDHQKGACKGRCPDSGQLDARNAATAMALLPLLGAGHSHVEGKYQDVVRRGLEFLIKRGKKSGDSGLSFLEPGGSMYSHGLATLALCEAFGLTRDMTIQLPAQQAINFVAFAQDPAGGGWRYQPRQAGDTSVSGWQFLALSTAHDAGLEVKRNTIRDAVKFLDSVAAGDGAFYGYTGPGRRVATTSIGLLCRIHSGWDHDREPLEAGVRWLAAEGPSASRDSTLLYYDYYATQVLWQYGGEHWPRWNVKLRDHLISEQAKDGHAAGSWYLHGDHGSQRGGRLYCTSLATLILEVYYRSKPMYERG